MIYPGSLNLHQGVDLAVKAFDLIKAKAPEAEMYIYGDGPARDALWNLVADMNIESRVFLRDALPLEEIIPIVAQADIGIVPKRAESFGNTAFSTKIFEFMALNVPAIVSKTAIDSHYFNDSIVRFFEPGNVESLAGAMLELIKDRQQRVILARNAAKFIQENAWEYKGKEYLDLVDRLTEQ
jgi:glycosyltransferase involved in cell wall biosynthesis